MCAIISFGSEQQGPVVGSFDCGNSHSDGIKYNEFFDLLRKY
jgi:hypothetical protein